MEWKRALDVFGHDAGFTVRIAGGRRARVWWAGAVDPRGAGRPPWAAAVLGEVAKQRFDTDEAAKEWAEAELVRIANEILAADNPRG